jgi:hypothetical protein
VESSSCRQAEAVSNANPSRESRLLPGVGRVNQEHQPPLSLVPLLAKSAYRMGDCGWPEPCKAQNPVQEERRDPHTHNSAEPGRERQFERGHDYDTALACQ